MSQSRKRRNIRSAAQQVAISQPPSADRLNRRSAIIVATVVVILILIIIVVSIYPAYIAPFRRNVITVNDINLSMDYFLKRIEMSGSDPLSMLTQLTNDQIVKKAAPQYGIEITKEDIDQALKSVFQGSASDNASQSFSQAEFDEWYRQLLNESRLSDAEYRDIIAIELMKSRLHAHLAAVMPTVAEQVHLYLIYVETQKQAEKVIARWQAGESFSELAKELSLDRTTGEKGGELGWFPSGGILTPQIEYEAFSLSTGNISQPLPVFTDVEQPEGGTAPTIIGYNIIMVTERAIRELDENALQVLRSKVLDDWLSKERINYNVKWRGLTGDSFDSETYAWIRWQIEKRKKQSR